LPVLSASRSHARLIRSKVLKRTKRSISPDADLSKPPCGTEKLSTCSHQQPATSNQQPATSNNSSSSSSRSTSWGDADRPVSLLQSALMQPCLVAQHALCFLFQTLNHCRQFLKYLRSEMPTLIRRLPLVPSASQGAPHATCSPWQIGRCCRFALEQCRRRR